MTMTIAGAWICGRRMEVMDIVMLVLILVLGPVTGASAQTTCSQNYYVGGSGSWNISANPDSYQTWASSIQFLPGDCIWFNRVTDGYVDEVSAQDYNSCNLTSPLAYFFGYANYWLVVGPFPVTQTYPQSYFFVEHDNTSCTAGMKFYATVVDPSSVPSPPPTSVNASTPPAPAPTPPISPPGPPTTPTPPLVGEPTPANGNGTSGKLSPGKIAGIAIAAIASALGVAGALVKVSNIVTINNYNVKQPYDSDTPFGNGAQAKGTKATNLDP